MYLQIIYTSGNPDLGLGFFLTQSDYQLESFGKDLSVSLGGTISNGKRPNNKFVAER